MDKSWKRLIDVSLDFHEKKKKKVHISTPLYWNFGFIPLPPKK